MTKTERKTISKQWTREGQRIFKRVYATIMANQYIMHHPEFRYAGKTQLNNYMPHKLWATVAWNSAWFAANAHDGK